MVLFSLYSIRHIILYNTCWVEIVLFLKLTSLSVLLADHTTYTLHKLVMLYSTWPWLFHLQ